MERIKNKSVSDFFKKNLDSLIAPIIMILVGVLFIIHPTGAITLTVKVIGVFFVLAGVLLACTLLASYSLLLLIFSGMLVIFGIVCIAASTYIARVVMSAVGVVVIVNSILRMYDAYLIKGKSDKLIRYVINDIVTLILGLILLFIPLEATGLVVRIIGIGLLVVGVSNIISAIGVYKDGRYVDDGTDVVWEE